MFHAGSGAANLPDQLGETMSPAEHIKPLMLNLASPA
jgi:hypothetical protein